VCCSKAQCVAAKLDSDNNEINDETFFKPANFDSLLQAMSSDFFNNLEPLLKLLKCSAHS
jgi:hypothetical protein